MRRAGLELEAPLRSRRLNGGANPAHDAVEAADVAQADMLRRVDRQPSRIGTAGRAPDVLRDWHGLMQEESRGAPPPRYHGLAVGAGHRIRLRWQPHAGTDGWRTSRVLLMPIVVGLGRVHDREEKQGRDPVRPSP